MSTLQKGCEHISISNLSNQLQTAALHAYSSRRMGTVHAQHTQLNACQVKGLHLYAWLCSSCGTCGAITCVDALAGAAEIKPP